MNLFTEQLNLSNEPIQKSPIKLPVIDENGEIVDTITKDMIVKICERELKRCFLDAFFLIETCSKDVKTS